MTILKLWTTVNFLEREEEKDWGGGKGKGRVGGRGEKGRLEKDWMKN